MDRLLVDLASNGGVRVLRQFAGEQSAALVWEGSVDVWPVGGGELDELRWYVEEYLRYPYGADADRGLRVGGRLRWWGEALFGTLFGAGPARDAYVQMCGRGGGRELLVRSDDVGLLRLPWELLWEPQQELPLTLSWDGVSRNLVSAPPSAPFTEVGGERLRVLMVIARPGGPRDVGYQMIARPLLKRLEAVAGQVDLEVLRPPTFETFQTMLQTAAKHGRPYQLVHFDGHGSLGRPATSVGSGGGGPFAQFRGGAGEARLSFEHPDGGDDPVAASGFAAAMIDGQVPLVVLNACESGAMGEEVEAAVATRLLKAGVGAVVAMAYRVYAVAAADFMTGLYDALFDGRSVAEAVVAGRRRLFDHDRRLSPKGQIELQDWMVPVLYARTDIAFPQLARDRSAAELSLDDRLGRLDTEPEQDEVPDSGRALAPVDGIFVGRDRAFFNLEAACTGGRPIVIYGPGGTGKTELVKAFARWRQATGALDSDRGVIFHSFEPGVATFSAAGVIATIGRQLFGHEFALVSADQQRAEVVDTLQKHQLLLIWDNFETVRSMPDTTWATGPLDEDEQDGLRRLLTELTTPDSRTVVLITSRTQERWLGDVRRIRLEGLEADEVDAYAQVLLKPYPTARTHREQRIYKDGLLPFMAGHPLSLRIILPQLEHTPPDRLLAGLQGQADRLPAGFEPDAARTASLGASVAYSLAHLDPEHQQRLLALPLFQDVVDIDVLAAMSGVEGVPARFATVDRDDWQRTCDVAEEIGLLTGLWGGMYRLHPALPAYLTALWATDAASDYPGERAAAELAMLDAYAAFGGWVDSQIERGDVAKAFALIDLQQRTMCSRLNLALARGDYRRANAILEPLNAWWDARGFTDEAAAWVDRIRVATETNDGSPPELGTTAGGLWLFAVTSQANRDYRAGKLDTAEHTYDVIRRVLETDPDTAQAQHRLAATYHQLGILAQRRKQLDKADSLCRRSLDIKEKLGNRPGMATTYHQLGIIAQLRGNLDQAEAWHRSSLDVLAQLRDCDLRGVASICHELGMVSQGQGAFDQAEYWHHQALEIDEQLGDQYGMASSYHQLGVVARRQSKLDEAEAWYRRSLDIKEQLSDPPELALTYGELGVLAQQREKLDQAEGWYRRALDIKKQLGDRSAVASAYHQVGMAAHLQGKLDDAEDCYRMSLDSWEKLGNQAGVASNCHLLGVVMQQREELDQAEAWYRRSLEMAAKRGDRPAMTYGQLALLSEARGDLRAALGWVVRCVSLFEAFPHPASGPAPAHLARLTRTLGLEALSTVWYEHTGAPLPESVASAIRAALNSDA